MEGVEDIPGMVMAEGSAVGRGRSIPTISTSCRGAHFDIDFASLLPHAPLRVHAMGQRAADLEAAT